MGLEDKERSEENSGPEVSAATPRGKLVLNQPSNLRGMLQGDQVVKERRPCVGLCHYYRTLGIENPFEKMPIKKLPEAF